MPNVMAALPNIGAPSVQRRKVWLTPNTGVPCSKAAKTRNPLKFVGVPKLPDWSQPLVGRSSPYCGDIWGRYWRLTSFFPIVDMCLNCKDIARQPCGMVPRWRLFGSPHKRGTSSPPPLFDPCVVAKRSPILATAELLLSLSSVRCLFDSFGTGNIHRLTSV